jgi:hypothetical protein
MVRFSLRSMLIAAAASAAIVLVVSQVRAQEPCPPGAGGAGGAGGRGAGYYAPPDSYCRYRVYGQPDLFYNFYVPGRCGGNPAAMYPAPIPTPPIVGHVYYTYQPFLPHEMMYRHHRHYYNFYDGGRGLNHTTVRWW